LFTGSHKLRILIKPYVNQKALLVTYEKKGSAEAAKPFS